MNIYKNYNEDDDTLFYAWYDYIENITYLYEDSSGIFGIVKGKNYDTSYPFKNAVSILGDSYDILNKIELKYKENMSIFVNKVEGLK